jgi:hypothetical protein
MPSDASPRHVELQFDIPQGPIRFSDWVAYSVSRDLSEDLERARERGFREQTGDPQTKLLCDGGKPRDGDDDRATGEDYQNTPIQCDDCGDLVVVTRPDDWESLDEQVTFECGCPDKIGHIASMNPDSWGAQFL